MTCWKQTRHRDKTWILTWETPLYHCCTSMYSGNLHSWQTFRAVKQLKSSSHTGSGLVFLLTTLGLFSWDFSLLKGKPSVCFYYEMPSITLISGCPRAPTYICQQRRSCLWKQAGRAAHPWIPTSDPGMLPAAVCALPASEWHLHPQTRVTPGVSCVAGSLQVPSCLMPGKGAVNNLIYLSILFSVS